MTKIIGTFLTTLFLINTFINPALAWGPYNHFKAGYYLVENLQLSTIPEEVTLPSGRKVFISDADMFYLGHVYLADMDHALENEDGTYSSPVAFDIANQLYSDEKFGVIFLQRVLKSIDSVLITEPIWKRKLLALALGWGMHSYSDEVNKMYGEQIVSFFDNAYNWDSTQNFIALPNLNSTSYKKSVEYVAFYNSPSELDNNFSAIIGRITDLFFYGTDHEYEDNSLWVAPRAFEFNIAVSFGTLLYKAYEEAFPVEVVEKGYKADKVLLTEHFYNQAKTYIGDCNWNMIFIGGGIRFGEIPEPSSSVKKAAHYQTLFNVLYGLKKIKYNGLDKYNRLGIDSTFIASDIVNNWTFEGLRESNDLDWFSNVLSMDMNKSYNLNVKYILDLNRTTTTSSTKQYLAEDKILNTRNFIIESPGNIDFISGKNILLNPGFHSKQGSKFRAKISLN